MMTIQIKLRPDEEAQLRARAAASGADPEEVATQILREQLLPPQGNNRASTVLLPVVDEYGVFHPERLEAVREFFRTTSSGLPSLPDAALTREALYQDHN